jgi:hypothetical protein
MGEILIEEVIGVSWQCLLETLSYHFQSSLSIKKAVPDYNNSKTGGKL